VREKRELQCEREEECCKSSEDMGSASQVKATSSQSREDTWVKRRKIKQFKGVGDMVMGGKVSAGRLQRCTARRQHGLDLPYSVAPVVHDVVHARGAPCASLRVVSTIKSLQNDIGEI